MEHSEGLSVQEASDQLGINEARVRALIKAGGLDANKIGGRWLVDPASVRRRLSASPGRGRPWKPEHVWDRLLALEGDPDHKVLSLVASDRPRSLKPWREARRLLDLVDKESASGLLARVRNRAEVRRLRAHPGIIKKILDDPRIVLSGASASAHHDLGLSAENEVDGY
ncbi:MAG: helix-turn-helix domain-containing protein, partial [Actinomycetota bacterium]